ncbi:hypothetical protein GIB67_009914 [Kingdonia uniflora]|uniref:Dolichyl-diphosphooligosaccharide--protein glycosyltransferase subunit 3B n=1 Tax=Kingdonia uniflora TaxID=39325 RepID=A0A7J7L4F9_9MAGN|nr:hypothetical protein GIB67_009914 [Kingdonia uniflora]
MSISLLLTLFLTLTLSSLLSTTSESESDLVSDLLTLQSQSKSGVIHLNDQTLTRFLTKTSPPRSYSLLIFFDAIQLHDKSELHLKELRSEFELVASAFITNNVEGSPARSKLFFCYIEFKESQSSFSLFSVNSLPHIRLVVGNVRSLKDSEAMDQGDFSRMAESMLEFVETKTRLSVGVIQRPAAVSKKQMGFLVVALLVSAPFFVKRLLDGDTLLTDSKLWLVFAVFVYFFSVSGAMHNIIRKMPMFLADRNDPSRITFFYQGSGMQLGAEGFAVGFLYTIVGLLLAFVTHILVRVKSTKAQRGFLMFALLVSFWAVKKVVYLDNWKTGYGIHAYWPTSWK